MNPNRNRNKNPSVTGFRAALILAVSTLLLAALTGCSLFPENKDPTKASTAAELYADAKQELKDGNWDKAIKLYQSLQSRYPYGTYSQQAQLEEAYAYYKQGEAESCISAADRFIKAHPNNPEVDYAYYIKGLANFKDDLGLFGVFSGQDLAERDQKAARDAFDSFRELVNRFPDSRYAADSLQRMNYLVNSLAESEVNVARYYYRRGAWIASADRAQTALKTYPRAPATEEALYLLVKSYEAMGIEDLRKDALRVLQTNFPESRYLAGTVIKNRPWWHFWSSE